MFFQRENKEPRGLKIFEASPKMVGLEIVAGKGPFESTRFQPGATVGRL